MKFNVGDIVLVRERRWKYVFLKEETEYIRTHRHGYAVGMIEEVSKHGYDMLILDLGDCLPYRKKVLAYPGDLEIFGQGPSCDL